MAASMLLPEFTGMSSSSSEDDLNIDNKQRTKMWTSSWRCLSDTVSGANFWYNDQTKEREFLPPELQAAKVLDPVSEHEEELEAPMSHWSCPTSESKEMEEHNDLLRKDNFILNTTKSRSKFSKTKPTGRKKIVLSLDDIDENESDSGKELDAFDEKLSSDELLPEAISSAGYILSTLEAQPLKLENGVHVEILFNKEWVPGVIIDTVPNKFVEVMFIYDVENFRKKLGWKSAEKKLRSVARLVHGTLPLSEEEILGKVEKFRQDNAVCADCTGESSWADLRHGMLLCSKCSGVHRNLGTHISKVRSLTLDKWTAQMYRSLRGNVAVNEELEYNVPAAYLKPHCDSHIDIREAFIKAKYKDRLFVKKPERQSLPALYDVPEVSQRVSAARSSTDVKKVLLDVNAELERTSVASKAQVLYDGFLIINCFEAKDLPTQSQFTRGKPNAYCVFLNGLYQKGRTKVCDGTKYPQFNSVVHVNVQEKEPLIVLVFDSCRIGKDVLLGSCQVDIKAEVEADKEKDFRLPLEMAPRFITKYKKKKKKKFPEIHFQVTYSRLI